MILYYVLIPSSLEEGEHGKRFARRSSDCEPQILGPNEYPDHS